MMGPRTGHWMGVGLTGGKGGIRLRVRNTLLTERLFSAIVRV
jgi:hypothetical protein